MEKLTLSYKCNQDWQQMPEKEAGRFCAQCNRCLIDFREKTLEEIAAIHANSAKPVCGIFKLEQVNYYNIQIQKRTLLKQLITFAVTTLAFTPNSLSSPILSINSTSNLNKDLTLSDQMKFNTLQKEDSTSFRGRMLDENKEPLIGANIIIKGTSIGTSTDVDGYFELKLLNEFTKKDSMTIIYSYTGFAPQEKTYKLDSIYDFFEKIIMIPDINSLEEVIVVGYIFPATKPIQSFPLNQLTSIKGSTVNSINLEQEIKYQKRSRLPWHKEFWQKRKQKKSSP